MVNPVDSIGAPVFRNAKELGKPTIPKKNADEGSEKNAVVYPGQHSDQEPPAKTQQVSSAANLEDILKQKQNGRGSTANIAEHMAKLKEANIKKTVKAKMSDGALTKMETHMAEARKVHKEKAIEERREKRDEIFYSEGSEKQGVDTMSDMKEHLKQFTEKSDDSSDEKISGVEQAQKQKIAAAAEHYKAIETAHNKDAAVEYPEQSISMMLA